MRFLVGMLSGRPIELNEGIHLDLDTWIVPGQDVSQDKELNRRIGLATMTFGKLKSMVFTSKKVSLRVKTMFIQPWFYQFFCMELQNHGPYPEPNCLG